MRPVATTRPLVDHTDVIAQSLDEVHDVAREHDRAASGAEPIEHRPHRARRHRVDAFERLVEQKEARTVQQGRGQ